MRIGINIPRDLHQRMEPFKQYINVSQICREAIEHRIRYYERALAIQSDEDVLEAIERAWEEERKMRDIIEVDWGMLGCQDAKSWVEAAELKDWDYLHHRQEVIDRQGRPRWVVPPPHLEGVKDFQNHYAELFNRMQQQDDRFFDWLYDEYGGIDKEAAEREYMSAWLAYTDSAWALFLEVRGRHLKEHSLSRPTRPTLPKKLLRELEA